MATIALYANKINQMPGLIKDVKQSVVDYKTELSTLKTKTLSINSSVCNLDDVISSIQTSTQTQEEKIASLDTFIQDSEEFISDVVRIDEDVADIVRQRKDDFYEQYYYLKPECEKNGWEKFKDGCKKVGEWCKDNWKKILICVVIAVACIVVGAVLTALTGGTFWAAVGAGLVKALIGGAISGIISAGITIGVSLISGENIDWSNVFISFIDGFVTGFAISGAFAGISMSLSSGVRFVIAKYPKFAKFLLNKGKVNEGLLKWLVPKGAKNTFVPNARINAGYKYTFKIGDTRLQLKWHAQDLRMLIENPVCNSGAGWTAQLQFGKKFLTTIGTLVKNNKQNITHIPITTWLKWR